MTAIPCEATAISTADLEKHFASIFALMRRRGWAGPGSQAVTRGACELATVFVAEVIRKCPGLGLPRVGPSALGGVGLQWDFGGMSVLVRIESDDPPRAHLLVNGPGFHEDDGAGHVSDVFEKVIAMCSRGMSRMDHEPPTADADESARARDLAELGDYVRLLADRMGLKDWTFEIDPELDEYEEGLVGLVVLDDPPRHGVFHVADAYFSASPEARRFAVVREYVFHHLYITDELEDSGEPGGGVKAIAAAWAPCLPLPLVGLMRRADEVARP